jgi:ADP-ribose pyrophosphatase YjhB (NUDIX family)
MARFNPDVPPPPGGFCISIFLTVREESKILLGKIGDSQKWSDNWGLGLKSPERWKDKWQLPGAYLGIGEHPLDTAARICTDQLELSNYSLSTNPRIFATSGENASRPGTIHNDLFFVFDMIHRGRIPRPAHFSELEFVECSKLANLEFGRGHDDVLRLSGFC